MQIPDIDDEGYLIDPALWNEEIANELAVRENIELTADHWAAIHFMRQYYSEHQVAPDVRHVMKHLAERPGTASRNAIFELFPYGYVKQACKIARHEAPESMEYWLNLHAMDNAFLQPLFYEDANQLWNGFARHILPGAN